MGFIENKTAGLITTRTAVLVGLLTAPIVVYSLAGSVAVWQLGWMRWLWWLAPIAWAVTWLISKLWPAASPADLDSQQPPYWTPRDEEAAVIVQRFQEDVEQYSTDQLTDPQFYLNQGQSIAHALAQHYRPGTTDPISDRTLPEILAACRLVADDLEELLLTSVPGSRLLTVNQWRKLSEAPRLVRQATKAFWATKILLNPFNLAQWGTSKITNDKVTTDLQSELISSLYVRFVKQLGYYLIEMNSGRLRAGADAYRSAFERFGSDALKRSVVPDQDTSAETTPAEVSQEEAGPLVSAARKPVPQPDLLSTPIRVAVMGQSRIGKSTLVQTLLGGSAVEVQPRSESRSVRSPTRSVRSYEFTDAKSGLTIHWLDTPGYESAASAKALLKPIQFAVENSHAILLLLNDEAEQWSADKELLEGIRESYRKRENLKPPNVIAIFSYFPSNLASPSPATTTLAPESAERASAGNPGRIEPVISRAQEQFKSLIDDYVTCALGQSDDAATFNSAFWTVFCRHLDAAHSNAVLAAFETSLNQGKYKILWSQAKTSGKQLFSNWFGRK